MNENEIGQQATGNVQRAMNNKLLATKDE